MVLGELARKFCKSLRRLGWLGSLNIQKAPRFAGLCFHVWRRYWPARADCSAKFARLNSVCAFQCPPVLHRLSHMRDLHGAGTGQVGNGARHLQAAVNAPARPAQAGGSGV